MTTTVLILAAGKQERFASATRKHFVPIGGELLICRTVRMATEKWNVTPVIISDSDEFITACPDVQYHLAVPDKCDVVCQTLLSSASIWKERTIVLLGDVYYTGLALDTIEERPHIFYGDNHDIFAMKFDDWDGIDLKISLNEAILNSPGKLWNCYRHFVGLPMDEHVEGHRDSYFFIYDDTIDFDTVDQYREFMRGAE